jgi:hypothetical protein
VKAKNKKSAKKTIDAHIKHLLVPHKANDFHPHLIRFKGIAVLLLVVIGGQFAYSYIAKGSFAVLGDTATTTVDGLLTATNAARSQNSLPSLTISPQLDQAAYNKAQDMLKHNYWAHVSPTGVQPWYWITATGYNYDTAGENLAKNYDSSQDTVNAWMASPTHRANVLNATYSQVGFAVVNGMLQGQETSLVVADYAEPAVTGVLGTTSAIPKTFDAPTQAPGNPLTYVGTIIQSLNPATVGGIALLLVGFIVAIASYNSRNMLPKSIRKTWKKHQALYKAGAFAVFAIVLVSITATSGQI